MKRILYFQTALLTLGLATALPGFAQVNADGTIDTGDAHDGQKLIAADSPAAVKKRLAWWTDARFGMFIHWGLYAQEGCTYKGQDGRSEHMMRILKIPLADYTQIATVFNPVKFNADEWVTTAKNAGMKYMVITSKHHDGFAMFDSPSHDFNIVKLTPWKRDPIKELAKACAKQGLKFGVYYSLGRDWADPDVPTRNGFRSNTWDYPDEDKKDFAKYFERKVKPQIRELLTQYGPIGVLWFDTPEGITVAQSRELIALIHSLQPDCIINARVGNRLGDYAVSEQKIPDSGDVQPWETCMTMNGAWGYHLGDENWKSTAMLVRNLVDIASKGGNFLLNVGPTGEGIISTGAVTHLKEVGDWMKVNGAAVYGTGPTAFGAEGGANSHTEKDKNGKPKFVAKWDWRCTTKAGKLYVTVFNWPESGTLELPGLQSKVTKVTLLANGKSVEHKPSAAGVSLQLPKAAPDKIATVFCVEIADAVAKVTRTTVKQEPGKR